MLQMTDGRNVQKEQSINLPNLSSIAVSGQQLVWPRWFSWFYIKFECVECRTVSLDLLETLDVLWTWTKICWNALNWPFTFQEDRYTMYMEEKQWMNKYPANVGDGKFKCICMCACVCLCVWVSVSVCPCQPLEWMERSMDGWIDVSVILLKPKWKKKRTKTFCKSVLCEKLEWDIVLVNQFVAAYKFRALNRPRTPPTASSPGTTSRVDIAGRNFTRFTLPQNLMKYFPHLHIGFWFLWHKQWIHNKPCRQHKKGHVYLKYCGIVICWLISGGWLLILNPYWHLW